MICLADDYRSFSFLAQSTAKQENMEQWQAPGCRITPAAEGFLLTCAFE